MRINKYIATAGVASRRKADELIKQGKVKINGAVVTDLATIVQADDAVSVDGKFISAQTETICIALNKPKGVVSTTNDDKGRKTVLDFLPGEFIKMRVYPIGRLDYDTQGLILLTNDGDLAYHLTHPKCNVKKTYIVKTRDNVSKEDLQKLRKGVEWEGIKYGAAIVDYASGDKKKLEVIISEGKNHQVKNMFLAIGNEVEFLKRTHIGSIYLGGLQRGEYRLLSSKEISLLRQ